MTSMNKVFADLPVTIFEAMSQLARDNNAINLGQGFPDDPGPEDIRRAASDAVMDGYNQYPSMMGIPELRQAIAAHYGRWHGLSLDPMAEVMVTSGGTEALTSAILAVVEPGDEVIVFQPVYDSYLPIIRQAGGIPRLLRLEPPHWRLSEEMLRSAFNHKTKAVLFNNPLNPAAVVYPREDLELLARFCQEFDYDRDLRRGLGACDLRRPRAHSADHHPRHARAHHQGRLGRQDLLADRLEDRLRLRRPAAAAGGGEGAPVSHLHHRAQSSGRGRLRPRQAGRLFPPDAQGSGEEPRSPHRPACESIGFPVLRSQGTYFLTVDLSPLGLNETDEAFCRRIVTDYKVAAIPVSAFYEKDAVTSVVRFCFAKKDTTLDTALERLSDAVHRR